MDGPQMCRVKGPRDLWIEVVLNLPTGNSGNFFSLESVMTERTEFVFDCLAVGEGVVQHGPSFRSARAVP